MSLDTRRYMWISDIFDLYRHFKMRVIRDGIRADDEVWVLRNGIRVLDFDFHKAPSPLYHKMTAGELEKELLRNKDDVNSGRRKL